MISQALSLRSLQLQVKICFVTLFAAAALFAMPHPAQAALNETQIQAIIVLLQSFNVDAATVNNVSDILHGVTTNSSQTPTCTMSVSASQVAVGQSFTVSWTTQNATTANLNLNPTFGAVSLQGYRTATYGEPAGQKTLTLNVTGTGGSTGSCSATVTVTSSSTTGDSLTTSAITASSNSSSDTRAVNAQFATNDCSSAGLQIDWGDNSARNTVVLGTNQCGGAAIAPSMVNVQNGHIYSAYGTYTIKLYKGSSLLSSVTYVATAPAGYSTLTGSVSGTTVTATYTNLPSNSYLELINQSSGTVTTVSTGLSGGGTATKTSVAAGTYKLRVKQSISGAVDPVIVESSSVTVSGSDSAAPTTSSLTVENNSSSNTRAVNAKFSTNDCSSAGLQIDWGDNSSRSTIILGTNQCGGAAIAPSMVNVQNGYIYAAYGTYTIKLYKGSTLLSSVSYTATAPQASASFDFLAAYSESFNNNLAAVGIGIIDVPFTILTDALGDLFYSAGIY
ncbi:hypothetical protein EXS62_01955 [Candidatus Kaiserbacteria bacterium]|nr:hypothetical protein [Candidatus Kaiserbacteria bacterium]